MTGNKNYVFTVLFYSLPFGFLAVQDRSIPCHSLSEWVSHFWFQLVQSIPICKTVVDWCDLSDRAETETNRTYTLCWIRIHFDPNIFAYMRIFGHIWYIWPKLESEMRKIQMFPNEQHLNGPTLTQILWHLLASSIIEMFSFLGAKLSVYPSFAVPLKRLTYNLIGAESESEPLCKNQISRLGEIRAASSRNGFCIWIIRKEVLHLNILLLLAFQSCSSPMGGRDLRRANRKNENKNKWEEIGKKVHKKSKKYKYNQCFMSFSDSCPTHASLRLRLKLKLTK